MTASASSAQPAGTAAPAPSAAPRAAAARVAVAQTPRDRSMMILEVAVAGLALAASLLMALAR